MKNKIIYSSLASVLIILWLVWITNANYSNLTKTDRESHKVVMNKIIDWETLTAEDKVILEEIKVQRAESETFRAERDAQRVALDPIFEKVKAGTALTTEEQTKLDKFKAEWKGKMWNFSKGGKWWKRGAWLEWGCSLCD